MAEAPVEGPALAVEQELPREHRHLHLPHAPVGKPHLFITQPLLYYTSLLHSRYLTTPLYYTPVTARPGLQKVSREHRHLLHLPPKDLFTTHLYYKSTHTHTHTHKLSP